MVDASGAGSDEGRGVAAISPGEVRATCDPGIPEWGNLSGKTPLILHQILVGEARPGEVKHLSTRRKRNQTIAPQWKHQIPITKFQLSSNDQNSNDQKVSII